MEIAIDALQDRIIYLTGQIVMIETEDMHEQSKKAVVNTWNREIEELKKAQLILSNCL